MGFTSAIYKAKRFTPETDFENLELIETYFDFKHNDWAQKNFETFADFCRFRNIQPCDIKKEALDFYTKEYSYKENQFNESLYDMLEDWGSYGTCFHDDLMKLIEGNKSDIRVFDKDDVTKLLQYAWNKIENYQLEPVELVRAYKVKEDADGEEITEYRRVDGIEVAFDDGTKRDLDSVCDCESEIYTSKQFIDFGNRDAYIKLIKCLTNIICTTDWDNELVYYCGGY